MKFSTGMPGLDRYPPDRFPVGSDHWQATMTGEDFQRVARAAEDLGFAEISVSEHFVLPTSLATAMGGYWPHSMTAMAFIAGATTRLRVNSSILVLPLHHPVALAKAIATLDVMSSGRVTVTCGLGIAPGEFAALGVPFERRGKVADEAVAAMKELWTAEEPEFAGEFVQFSDVVFEPRPVQRPHPPLWFGGRSMAAFRRAAREGDGWAPAGMIMGKGPWLQDASELPALLEPVRDSRAAAGDDRPFDINYPVLQPRIGEGHSLQAPAVIPDSAQAIIDEVGRLAECGVTYTSVPVLAPVPDTLEGHLEGLQWIAEEIIPAFR